MIEEITGHTSEMDMTKRYSAEGTHIDACMTEGYSICTLLCARQTFCETNPILIIELDPYPPVNLWLINPQMS